MLFSSTTFLFLFLPAVLLLTALSPRRGKNSVLLAASLLFYGWGEPRVLLAMLFSIALNWVFGLIVGRHHGTPRARWAVAGAVVANLALLGYYKYANFFVENVNVAIEAAGGTPFAWERVALPIGISFFTFQAMSYVIDVYRRDAPPQKNPANFALYIALFPQLIAGPIVRYRDVAEQILERRTTLDGFIEGVRRFLIGLGKKMLVANSVAVAVDEIFAVPSDQITPAMAWLAMVCYALQIYFDFSGYSDMAIGLGRMFGFRFLENFDYPYVARSITEFWRRWHISLSSWFRDYLYIPLGGGRVPPWKVYRNLLIVFFLCGLWHGASWAFVLWGLYHGLFLVIERLGFGAWLARRPAIVRRLYTLLVVVFGWVPFRAGAEDLSVALRVAGAMLGMTEAAGTQYHFDMYVDPVLVTALVAGLIGAVPVLPALRSWRASLRARGRSLLDGGLEVAGALTLLAVLVASAMLMAAGTHNPFIYLRF